jgi:hypothetical protein
VNDGLVMSDAKVDEFVAMVECKKNLPGRRGQWYTNSQTEARKRRHRLKYFAKLETENATCGCYDA